MSFPLIIERLEAKTPQFMSKGHHSFDAFARTISAEYSWSVEEPRHIHIRRRLDPTGEFVFICEEVVPATDTFPATVASARSYQY